MRRNANIFNGCLPVVSPFLDRRCFFLEDVDGDDCEVVGVFWVGVVDDDLGQELVNELGYTVGACQPLIRHCF